MTRRSSLKSIIIVILACLGISTIFFLPRFMKPPEKITIGWKEDFDTVPGRGRTRIPKGWRVRRKPGTSPAVFSVGKDEKQHLSFLHMEADDASASLLCRPEGISLERTPVLRWRWRATVLPKGADGRVKAKDDQAIGIYVGSGKMIGSKTVSYRWDTETPKGATGNCVYGKGTIKVKWYTLRNKEDAGNQQWFVEERNCAEDFKKAWGYYPEKIYLSVSCNSQYTGTRAAADLDWIEFIQTSDKASGGSIEQNAQELTTENTEEKND